MDENLSSEVQIFLSATNLPDLDHGHDTTDPFAVIYAAEGGQWVKIGATEVLKDHENPEWTTQFTIQCKC